MERTIRVTGKGKISVKPDTIRLIMTVEGTNKVYDKAVKESAEKTEKIKDMFENLGFERDKVKTLYFNVEAEFENFQISRTWKKRFKDYRYTHRTKIEFPVDNEMLGKVLYALSRSLIHPEFDIDYTVADPEKPKNQLLEKAIKDSMEKAQVLAKASGVKLGNILNIDYSWGEVDFVSRPMRTSMYASGVALPCGAVSTESYDIDIDPDDIDVSDTVTIVWSIE